MSRKRIVAGNWKMNTTLEEAASLARAVAQGASTETDLVLIPPACFLPAVLEATAQSPVGVGAQNLHPATSGAFTGETSGPMLTSLGAQYVVCGHSERRHVFGEQSDFIGEKVTAAHAHGLTPILCVGETLEDREADRTNEIVLGQLDAGLSGLEPGQIATTVVAYEPVWAIGTGRTASPEQAQEVHATIRARLSERFGASISEQVRIQYGGSVKPTNAAELLGQPDIDGALVGGASLVASSFLAIADA
jgi:triosephosphate isomerase (TIM)